MDKAQILQEIKRTAHENGGVALGAIRFESETGIRQSDWLGKFWARWSDALVEAGVTPNQLNPAIPVNDLLEKYAKFALELGRLPVFGDLLLKERCDPEFPSRKTYLRRFGSKAELVRQVLVYCHGKDDLCDVAKMCEGYAPPQQEQVDKDLSPDVQFGFVYLLKHGSRREYKIGRTNNPLRREGEIGIELPEKIQPIHVIKTDDPAGVEAYWHRRFASKRKEGEWFGLTVEDVRAFKRWKRIF